MPSVEALLGATVSVEVTTSDSTSFVDVGNGAWTPVGGAEVVKGANPAPLMDAGEALCIDAESWL